MTIELIENKDILASVCQLEKKPICIGFAAETENHIENAKIKLKKKKCDAILLNDVSQEEIGLNSNENEVHLITKNKTEKIEKNTKQVIAEKIINKLANSFFMSS
jgi:phosphopantothenoylcysteine decarboxylase/phosphopantothenate--cysteine ligase